MSQPSIGRIVLFKLNQIDAEAINKRREDFVARTRHLRDALDEGEGMSKLVEVAASGGVDTGFQAHVGNRAEAGQVYPALVVRRWGDTPESAIQLQVFLDGNDTYWATSVAEGDGEHQWQWPVRD